MIRNLPDNTVNRFLNNGFGQTRNSDIPYIGAPERGWVPPPNIFGGTAPFAMGDVKLESSVVQNDETSSTVGDTASDNTSWESIWYAERSTIVGVYCLTPRLSMK